MTKAEKLMQAGNLSIELNADSSDGPPKKIYVAELKPDYLNPLHIKDIDYSEESYGNWISISYESAVELAKFLKRFFLDEDPVD
ncbi:MAG: hypothetical protein LBF74_07375 [Treponema sp.]|jgi:hypothetical protein|nr:hypothetical protein [Treponema sp.]